MKIHEIRNFPMNITFFLQYLRSRLTEVVFFSIIKYIAQAKPKDHISFNELLLQNQQVGFEIKE